MKTITLFFSLFFTVSLFAQGDNPYEFIENKGQFPNNVLFQTKLLTGNLFLESNQFTFDLYDADEYSHYISHDHDGHNHSHNTALKKHNYSMVFLGSNFSPKITSSSQSQHYFNYFLGNDKSKWKSKVHCYKTIEYENLYNNIDLKIYSTEWKLKYDFIVHPKGNPNNIKIDYNNVNSLHLENGHLIVTLSTGIVKELKPYAYQNINGLIKEIDINFVLNGSQLSFNIGNYDGNYPLVIDPTFVFATLTGSSSDNWGYTATYDSDGNLYSGGIVLASAYPTTTGAYSTTYSGGVGGVPTDIVITKYSADGSSQIYSTFLGGSENDVPHSLINDSQNQLVLMGSSSSNNYPTTTGAFDETFNGGTSFQGSNSILYNSGSDIVITKFNEDGTALLGSSFIGGSGNDGLNINIVENYSDEVRGEVFLNDQDEIYVTTSTLSSDFPTTAGSYSQVKSGGQDAVVFSLSEDLSALNWSTYLGGVNDDAGYSIRVSPVDGNIFICGGTKSTALATTPNVLNPNYLGGNLDGYVASIDKNNGNLINLSYIGTNAYDQTFILDIDQMGDIYVVGQTLGNYSVSNANYSVSNSPQFIHKMDNTFTNTHYSTVFGSGDITDIDISLTAFLVDTCGNVYVSGWGGTTNASWGGGSTNNLPITSDAQQSTTDGSDFYFFVLERDAENLLYGSYLGSTTAREHVDGGTSRYDKSGVVYQAVCAACGGNSFPTTAGVWSQTNGSSNCNMGSIKFLFDYQDLSATPEVPEDILICSQNFDVEFNAGVNPPPQAEWDFGDNSGTSTELNPTYTYSSPGTYTVRFIAIDPSSCKQKDTAYFDVKLIQTEEFSANINFSPPPLCGTDSLLVELAFTGTGADEIVWNMGNGDIFETNTISYYYKDVGTYEISMTATDTLCKKTEVITKVVEYKSKEIIKDVVIPNVFTPNSDLKNDFFTINYIDPNSPFEIKIFNRWGTLIYESMNSEVFWNGKNKNGELLNDDVYYYIINYSAICNPEPKVKNGYVHLFR